MAGNDDGGLFAGIEQPTKRVDDQPPLQGGDAVAPSLDPAAMLKRWARDLSYDEIHAFVVGFAPWFLFLVTGHPALLAVSVGTTAAALGYAKVQNRALRYIVREAHYCLAGSVVAWVVGSSILAWGRLFAVLGGVVA